MKKWLVVLLSSLFLIACSTSNGKSDQSSTNEITDSEEAGIEVDKGLMNVEITLPEMFFDDDELADIEEEMEKSHNANVTKNDDGSITVKMSNKDHKQLMSDMQDEFMETIDNVINEKDYQTIKDITYNRDFSEFKVFVEKDGFENSFDGIALFSIGFSSLLYQLFDGKDIGKDKVTMSLIDEASNEEFEKVIYPDVFDEIEGLIDGNVDDELNEE